MSVSAILNANGKVPPQYIELDQPPFTGFVKNPLTASLQCYNPDTATNYAVEEASYVSAGSVKTDKLELLPGTPATAIRSEANIEMATGTELEFEGNAVIKSGAATAMEYNATTKRLTVNPPSVPPSPLLPTQGVTVQGGISATGSVVADGDIQTNNIFIAKGAGQPRIEFQDGTGFAQMETGWSAANARGVLRTAAFEAFNDNTKKYLINYGDNIGYLGLETKGVDTEIRHYDATASVMETRVKVEGGGVVSITGAVAGGGIKVENVITPAGNIGAPGEYLVKSGTNEIAWAASAPGTWAGTALSDLDMNGFKITDATQLNLTAPSLALDGIPSASAANVLNYDATTKLVSYSLAPPYTFLRSAPLPFVPPATIPSGTATAVSYAESGTVLGSDLTLNGSGGFVCNTNGQYAINVEICGTFASPAHLDAPPYIELFDTTTSTVLRRQFLTYYEAPPSVPHAKKLQFLVNSASGLIAGSTYVFRIFQQNVGGLAMSIDYTPFSFTPTISGYFITRLS